MDVGDRELVREYANRKSEQACAGLVKRHVDLVYSVALRQAQDPHLAEEITQAVFIILSRKAGSLGRATILPAWLCRTARYAAADALKRQRRRREREQEAYMRSQLHESESTDWAQIAPLLDAGMEHLGRKEHDAITIRFLKGCSFNEVGAALGTSEAAAKMRVTRALEKLRKFFAKRDVTLSTTAIATAMSLGVVKPAPASLAASAVAASTVKGVAIGGSSLAIAEAALKGMAWIKAKTLLAAGVGVLAMAGAITVTVAVSQRPVPWQISPPAADVLERTAPQVHVLPTRFSSQDSSYTESYGGNVRMLGLNQSIEAMILTAYGSSPGRAIFPADMPGDHYDYIANLPSGSAEALQKEIQTKTGFSAVRETRETDVLLLRVGMPNAPGLKPASDPRSGGTGSGPDNIRVINGRVAAMKDYLEAALKVPIIDQTRLDQNFDINLRWRNADASGKQDPAALKQALASQLGLELVPARMPMEMLIVERR